MTNRSRSLPRLIERAARVPSIFMLALALANPASIAHAEAAAPAPDSSSPAAADAGTAVAAPGAASEALPLKKDVPFVPTPDFVVNRMLEIANVGPKDVLYDLGSGDGRIVIAAAKRGARAVGIDIDPELIEQSRQNAKAAGVGARAKFLNQDLFKTDLREASVVTLYLLPGINLKLRPKLLAELAPGTRIVSHSFDMGDWKPIKMESVNGALLYFWTVPPRGTEVGASSKDATAKR